MESKHHETLNRLVNAAIRNTTYDLLSALAPNPQIPIVDWIRETAGFSPDPYQIEPLEEIASPGARDVTVVAVEQIGKSEIWRSYLLFRLATDPCQAMVVYPSDDLAADENRDKLEPRMRAIPSIAAELDRPKTSRKDAYHFDDSIVYFTGAGTPLLAKSIEVAIADEVDFWVGLTNDNAESRQSMRAKTNVSNLANLWKRTRTFRDRRKLLTVCSPTLVSAPIWQRFLRGSQGTWNWMCLGCGDLIPSHSTYRLQFEREEDEGAPIVGSARLVCEHCGREHEEFEAEKMNRNGRYVHKFPERIYKSYQVGALACPRAIGWDEVAEAIVAGGSRGSTSDQKILDNSYRGLPLQPRKVVDEETETIVEKKSGALQGVPAIVFASVDTQDDCFYAIKRGVLKTGQTIGCGAKRCETLDELGEFVDDVAAGMIDEGGHRCEEVVEWVRGRPRWWTYKGDSQHVKSLAGWKRSTERSKLILANPYHFQAELLSLLYLQTNPEAPDFWALPEEMDVYPENYIDQLVALKPNSRKRHGHEFRNWTPDRRADHFFDAEKMLLVLLRVAAKKLPSWEAPAWVRSPRKRRRKFKKLGA